MSGGEGLVYQCQRCLTGVLRMIPDAHTFYPRGFCYQCDSCGLKVHPDAADGTPEEFCELFGHRTSLLNRLNPFATTMCVRCGDPAVRSRSDGHEREP